MDQREFLRVTLARVPELPCRVDEMTAREYAIFTIASQALAALHFLEDSGVWETSGAQGKGSTPAVDPGDTRADRLGESCARCGRPALRYVDDAVVLCFACWSAAGAPL